MQHKYHMFRCLSKTRGSSHEGGRLMSVRLIPWAACEQLACKDRSPPRFPWLAQTRALWPSEPDGRNVYLSLGPSPEKTVRRQKLLRTSRKHDPSGRLPAGFHHTSHHCRKKHQPCLKHLHYLAVQNFYQIKVDIGKRCASDLHHR